MLKLFQKSKISENNFIKFNGIFISDNPKKKYKASFNIDNNEHIVYFGNSDIYDYTQHLDHDLKQSFIVENHTKDWAKPTEECSLRRWILYNKCTLNASIEDYKRRFNFE